MILKFIEAPLLQCRDEAEAIAILNDFLAELGKKSAQESKIQQEEEAVKVREGEDGGEGGGREGEREGGEGGRERERATMYKCIFPASEELYNELEITVQSLLTHMFPTVHTAHAHTQRQAPVSVRELLKQSYESFGFISNPSIERMRNGARLQVCKVQTPACVFI